MGKTTAASVQGQRISVLGERRMRCSESARVADAMIKAHNVIIEVHLVGHRATLPENLATIAISGPKGLSTNG
jgi:hypothetical protein